MANCEDKQVPTAESEEPPEEGKVRRRLIRALLLIMLFSVPIAVYERQWMSAFLVLCIAAFSLLPWRIGKRMGVRIPIEFELLAVLFIFAALFLGSIHGYYERFWWWDVVLHTSSGFLLGILGFLLVYALNRHESIELHMTPVFVALFAFAFAMAVGALWEVFEFGMDELLGYYMQKGLTDTMWDLIVDAAGALVMAASGYVYMRTGKEHFVERWIARFVQENPSTFRPD
ncbi:MAG: hypothetical protein R6V05_05820 [Candidatus Brocadiia bacterium]